MSKFRGREALRGQRDHYNSLSLVSYTGSVWNERKKERDNDINGGAIGNLWQVHGKLYDLTEFINLHPGGKFWIESVRESYKKYFLHEYYLLISQMLV
jgi:hypothetical protein